MIATEGRHVGCILARSPFLCIKRTLLFLLVVLLFGGQANAGTTENNADKCFKRAQQYEKEANKYANDVRDPSKWFDLAMKNYLCASEGGNPMASYRAVSLSGSGQVKALPKEMEDHLLRHAAEAGIPEAQIGLADTICENFGTRNVCKNPVEGEKWLLRAARSGSGLGAFSLGYFYEMGQAGEGTTRTEKALACYKISQQRYLSAIKTKGNKDLRQLKSELDMPKQGIERTLKKLEGHDISASCY